MPAILFDSDRDGESQLFAATPDGSSLLQLTEAQFPGGFSRLPDWSPDCSRVAFQSNLDDPDGRHIYVMSIDGNDTRRLTNLPGPEESPAWSPDGQRIAFAAGDADDEGVWVVNVDGSELRRVTRGIGPAFQPAWSPDGDSIAFVSGSAENWDLFVTRVDLLMTRKLTNTPARHEGGPAYSPDGGRILFDALEDGHWEIYVMNTDGTNERRLTDNSAMDARPAWSPDGAEIVFHSTRAFGTDGDIQDFNQVELYVMNADGTEVRRLTDNQYMDAHPDWCGRMDLAPDADPRAGR